MSLEKLKELRIRRMEQCFIELQTHKQVLSEWQINAQKKRQQLAAFQQWRLNHQETLFTTLKDQPFSPQNLLDYRAKLEQLRQQEEQLRQELAGIQQALENAQIQVQRAQQQSTEANIKLEKLKEIILLHDGKKPLEEPAQ
jgi:chromosome segregation ATPase